MKVIALLSGGKDSIYNLHHAILNNHEPVCVASLGPPEGQDELDSFMYQTVAHSGLETLARALDLPFFSTAITGKPINQSATYGSRTSSTSTSNHRDEGGTEEEHDETEDLYRLLKMVKDAMPEVEAVAAGAILSNYQRVRVEHVCLRLGLTSIAYLWERNQRELLDEMVASGQQSVIVKVAGAGLGVQHLGKTLGQMQPILHKLNERYETHVCGEGGEYETFTLDSPIFKKRIVLEETQTIVSNPDPHSTVAHLYLSRLALVGKPDHPQSESFEELRKRLEDCIRIPETLGSEALTVKEAIDSLDADKDDSDANALPVENLEISGEGGEVRVSSGHEPRVTIVDQWLNFSSISATNASENLPVEQELEGCFEKLVSLLAKYDCTLENLSHLNLLLSPESMPLFPRINKVYSTFFGSCPPTRACVSVRFANEERSIRIKIDGIARLGHDLEGKRTALHVQSLSYWGAANIGPYSQAITVGNRCYIAGQIPLVPRSLTLQSPPDFAFDIALSLQHVSRIAKAASESRWQGWNEGGVVWVQEDDSVWNQRVRGLRKGWQTWNETEGRRSPPLVIVSAAQLPRSASLEWQFTWQTGQAPWTPDDDDEDSDDSIDDRDDKRRKPVRVETSESSTFKSRTTGKKVSWQCSEVRGIADSVVGIVGCSIDETDRLPDLDKLGTFHSIKAFYKPHLALSKVEQLANTLLRLSASSSGPAITFVGSRTIETLEDAGGHDVAFVFVAQVLQQY
ncbi:diphthine--ammonia ligase [Sporobolomyces koalae]|uniref:diphthine--ammonia ligase n=1 Tax=Sporobolomyces koalae TaxID=500713 RepID=UPI003175C5A4